MSSKSNPLNQEIRTGPRHHLHGDNEPLPGSKDAATTVDYTPETIDQTRLPPSEEGDTQNLTYHPDHHRHNGHDNLNLPQQNLPEEGETAKPIDKIGVAQMTSYEEHTGNLPR